MELSPYRIFISYSRRDGLEFAKALERRLEDKTQIRSWRDIKSLDAPSQVLRAIEGAEHLVLVLTRQALVSEWTKREWSHARMVGTMVSPVLADRTIKRSDLPPWIRSSEVFDIADRERWARLVQILQGPGKTRRVPYMPGDMPDGFVLRATEYGKLKEAVLSVGTNQAVALIGAGGSGKTTLANYLCRDSDVRFEFTDGIIRVEVGDRDDVTGLLLDLIEKLDPEGRRPGFSDVVTASEHLGEVIGEARLLLVVDDVRREAQLRPFLRGGPNAVRLVTTRLPRVLPEALIIEIAIDAMRDEEALDLISLGLPEGGEFPTRARLQALVDRLGRWALALKIANGWMRERLSLGEPLEETIHRFEQRLSKHGLTAFDPLDETQRNRSIRDFVEPITAPGISVEEMKQALAAQEATIRQEIQALLARQREDDQAIVHPQPSSAAYERIASSIRQNLEQIERNIAQTRGDSTKWFLLMMGLTGAGVTIILAGILMMLMGLTAAGTVTTATSVLPNAFAFFLFRKDSELRKTLGDYHAHVLSSQNILSMVDLAETLTDPFAKDAAKVEIIKTTIKAKEADQRRLRAAATPAVREREASARHSL